MNEKQEAEAPSPVVLAVVGAGHVPGMVRKIQDLNQEEITPALEERLKEISEIPPRSFLSRAFPWLVVLAIIALLTAGFITNGLEGRAPGAAPLGSHKWQPVCHWGSPRPCTSAHHCIVLPCRPNYQHEPDNWSRLCYRTTGILSTKTPCSGLRNPGR